MVSIDVIKAIQVDINSELVAIIRRTPACRPNVPKKALKRRQAAQKTTRKIKPNNKKHPSKKTGQEPLGTARVMSTVPGSVGKPSLEFYIPFNHFQIFNLLFP